jgi:hypothetical protein
VLLVAPCPSVPPGADDKPEKAIKPRKRAKNIEERYIGETDRVDRDVDAPTIGRDRDGDLAATSGFEPAQSGLHVRRLQETCRVAAV